MPTYTFECTVCHNRQDFSCLISEYDSLIKDGVLKEKCETCKVICLLNRIIDDFQVMGGTTGYKSVERFWEENPSLKRRKTEE